MMKSLEEYDGKLITSFHAHPHDSVFACIADTVKPFERDLKQDFLKPGFEHEIKKELQKEKRLDTDLDGE